MGETVWLTVEVTEEDIKAGKRGKGDQCPIACALRRKGDPYPDLYVGPNYIDCDSGRFRTPGEAKAFIQAFDSGFPVQPFTFKTARVGS